MSYRDNLPVPVSANREIRLSQESMDELVELAENFAFDGGVAKLVIDEVFDVGEFALRRNAAFDAVCGELNARQASSSYRSATAKDLKEALSVLLSKTVIEIVGTSARGMINSAQQNMR